MSWHGSDGSDRTLIEWRGHNVSILAERDDLDPMLVQRLLDALDRYWVACRTICGNTPPSDGRLTGSIGQRAVVIACGNLPAASDPRVARIEIGGAALDELLGNIARDDRSPLGADLPLAVARTFAYFEDELGAATPAGFAPLSTALATLLAGHACDSLDWIMPPDPRPIEAAIEGYERDPAANYEAALRDASEHHQAEAETLWTAILLRTDRISGQRDFTARLWKTLAECPIAEDVDTAVGNLIVATSAASRSDLLPTFSRWRFPISEATRDRVQQAITPTRLDVKSRSELAPRPKENR